MKNSSRRKFLGGLVALPAGLGMTNFSGSSTPVKAKKQIKITAIKAMQLDFQFDGCLIKIETDAGLVGYGEAGVDSKIARAHIEHLDWALQRARGGSERLIGADPLSIQRHFYRMTEMHYPLPAPMGTISGIDIALWDLAGKILDQPVYKLLGGPFREGCPMYSHGSALENMLDPASCRKWAEHIKQQPEGFNSFKIGLPEEVTNQPGAPFLPTITKAQLRVIKEGFTNIRDAVGDSIEIGLHCHGEFNTVSSIAIANTVEPLNVVFIEDPLNPQYSEGWAALKRGTKLPVLTGEKLETVRQFKPFIDAGAVDFVHPDISYAGGFSGCMKIADYAAITRTQVALHNVGSLVRTYASAHLSMSIQNFYKSESSIGETRGRVLDEMSSDGPAIIRNSILKVSDRPGLGLNLDEKFLKKHLPKGEPWWG
ncbi:MAG: mandelate racemase/muconate lactonizing enzyme family protein [Saprospiraceae bacterium]